MVVASGTLALIVAVIFVVLVVAIREQRGSANSAIIQPGGSQRDHEVVELCEKAGVPMVFTSRRHFRH